MPSTAIAWFHYDRKASSLLVSFISGARYIYKNVPLSVYQDFSNASSKGGFLNKQIKGHYEFEKIDPDNTEVSKHSR